MREKQIMASHLIPKCEGADPQKPGKTVENIIVNIASNGSTNVLGCPFFKGSCKNSAEPRACKYVKLPEINIPQTAGATSQNATEYSETNIVVTNPSDSEMASLITEIRDEYGLTQDALAERLDTTQSSISDFERGTTGFHFRTVGRLVKTFGGELTIKIPRRKKES